MYSSSEPDLERVRAQYFEVLKQEHDEFPFGLDSDLKRRMFRGNGDPIVVKLAQDIYTIISVSQGEEYNLLRDMISTSRRRTISVAAPVSEPKTPTSNRKNGKNGNTDHSCQCAAEIALLKDTVSSLQAGFLLLKQYLHASDNGLCKSCVE